MNLPRIDRYISIGMRPRQGGEDDASANPLLVSFEFEGGQTGVMEMLQGPARALKEALTTYFQVLDARTDA